MSRLGLAEPTVTSTRRPRHDGMMVWTTPEMLEAARASWDDLVRASGARGPFATAPWLLNWWRHFGRQRDLLVACGRDGERLRWGLPLSFGEETIGGLRVGVVRSLTNVHSGPLDALVRQGGETGARAGLFRLLADLDWHIVIFEYLPEESHLSRWLVGRYPVYVRPGLHSPFVLLERDFESFLAVRGRHFRQRIRRKLRKASNTAGFEIRTAIPGEVVPGEFWTALEHVERHSWKAQTGTAIVSEPVTSAYYWSLVQLVVTQGWSYFTWCRLHGEPVAYDLAVAYGDTVYSLKIGYHQEYKDLSPGLVAKTITIQRACEDGYRENDLMGHVEPWKMSFTNNVRRHVTLYVFNPARPRAMFLWRFWFRPRERLGRMSMVEKLRGSKVGQVLVRRLGLV